MLRECVLVLIVISVVGSHHIVKPSKPIPHGWSEMNAPPTRPITLTFAIKQRNLDTLRLIAESVSDPKSREYRKFLSRDRLINLIAPSDSTIDTLSSWMIAHSVPEDKIELNPSKDFIILRQIDVSVAASLLSCKFKSYIHTSGRFTQACIDDYQIPSDISSMIDFIGGVRYFPKMKYSLPLAPRASPNAPYIVKASPGDENFGLFILPMCPSGGPATSMTFECSGGTKISSVQVTARQYYSPQIKTMPIETLACGNCSSWPSALQQECQQTNSQFSLPDSSIYCQTLPITEMKLKNYVNVSVSVLVTYSSGFNSDSYHYPNPFFLGQFVTPQLLKEYYDIAIHRAISTNIRNSQSVAEFLGQNYAPSDLLQFFNQANVLAPGKVELVGPNDPTNPGLEASLDIEC